MVTLDVSDIELGILMTCHQRSLLTHGLMSKTTMKSWHG